MHINIINGYKSIPNGIEFELPNFSVITGKNGSGKTHLLEALTDTSFSKISFNNISKPINNIKLIRFGELNPSINETCSVSEASQFFKDPWHQIRNLQNTIKSFPNDHPFKTNNKTYIDQQHAKLRNLIYKIMDRESIDFMKITEDHVILHASTIFEDNGQLFTSQLAKIFKAYHTRYIKNEFQNFLNVKYGESRISLSESEFINIHGPKPWEIINFLEQASHIKLLAQTEAILILTTHYDLLKALAGQKYQQMIFQQVKKCLCR